MQSIVISIGGSVVLSEDVDVSYFKKLADILEGLAKECKVYLVVGGGNTAREYIRLGRTLNLDEKKLDQIGIDVTRVNARMLASFIENSNYDIPKTTDEAIKIDKSIVIMGGTMHGHSTDMVGAELSEKVGASKFIIATNVDGIYDKDPNKYDDAEKFSEISIKELISKYGIDWNVAGKNVVIDGPALEIIHRSKIPTFVLNGKKLDELENAIKNKPFNGTKITL